MHFVWALALGAISAASLPLGSLVGLKVRFNPHYIAWFAAFGAGALIAALSVELVAPTALALTHASEGPAAEHAFAHFIALVVGAVLGGLLFVALDSVVNSHGGHVRKASGTLAYIAKRNREDARRMLSGVLAAPPFNSLPEDLVLVLGGMLTPTTLKEGRELPLVVDGEGVAYVLMEGEVEFELDGKSAGTSGPGTLVGLLPLLVPGLVPLTTIRSKTTVSCLALNHQDLKQLQASSPAFDRACRDLGATGIDRIEEHLTMRLRGAVEWTRQAAGALRGTAAVPTLTVERTRAEREGSPLAVWLGILLDGIPESVVIGAGMYLVVTTHPNVEALRFGQVIPYTLVAGLFLSNFPEALSSSSHMLTLGWRRGRIFMMWFALMVMTSLGSGLGYVLAGVISETWLVFAEGLAAGAMLTMIAAAMLPEAAAHGRPNAVGLSTLAGFLAAILFKLLEHG